MPLLAAHSAQIRTENPKNMNMKPRLRTTALTISLRPARRGMGSSWNPSSPEFIAGSPIMADRGSFSGSHEARAKQGRFQAQKMPGAASTARLCRAWIALLAQMGIFKNPGESPGFPRLVPVDALSPCALRGGPFYTLFGVFWEFRRD